MFFSLHWKAVLLFAAWSASAAQPLRMEVLSSSPGPSQALRFAPPPPQAPVDQPCVADPSAPPSPTADEVQRAVQILGEDSALGAGLRAGKLVPYPAMPPLVQGSAIPDGQKNCRVISIGVRTNLDVPGPAPSDYVHEIVGVNLSQGKVIHFAANAPDSARVTERVCGFPRNRDINFNDRGTEGQATLRFSDDRGELWRFTVIRPSASSGDMGSGIEFRDVYYRNKLVVLRMHVPILNVKYVTGACGPYRDWQYQESPIQVGHGFDAAPGVRIATDEPKTIVESSQDDGNFKGAAIFQEPNGAIRVVGQLSAGWYRYISKYTFQPNGTIQPRWGFTGTENSCTCQPHQHHAYWRFDFAVGGKGDQRVDALQFSDEDGRANPQPITTETKLKRNDDAIYWYRIRNDKTKEAVSLIPGSDDGAADDFSKGDLWVLNAPDDDSELSDHHTNVVADVQANIDSFVNPKEKLKDSHLAVWYAGHFMHDELNTLGDNDERHVHFVGPDIKVIQW